MNRPLRFLFEVFQEFAGDRCDALAGTIAFFTLFSLPPILALVVDVAGLFIGTQAAVQEVESSIRSALGAGVAQQVARMLELARNTGQSGLASRLGSITLLLFSATVVLAQAQRALNHVWKVESSRGVVGFLQKRGISLLFILGFVLLVIGSNVTGALLSAFRPALERGLPDQLSVGAFMLLTEGTSLGMLFLSATMLHQYLPEATIPWRDAIVGGLVTTLLMKAGQLVVGTLISKTDLGNAYGTASSLAVLLFWVFYGSAIFLWGAEFTKVWSRWRGHEIHPREGAVSTRTP